MKRIILAASLALVTACTTASHSMPIKQEMDAASPKWAIVPGKSVGKVWLGATRLTVRKILGKPSATFVRKGGITVDEWLGAPVKQTGNWNGEMQRRLAVIYRSSRAVQIELNSPSFHTREGISTRNSLAQFRKFYHPRRRTYLYLDEGGGGYRGYVYDDVKRGLAFTFGAQDYYDSRVVPETLRVHRPGFSLIPDPGGKLIKANDELRVGQKPPV